MKKIIIAVILAGIWPVSAQEQIYRILENIERNNPTLHALREGVKAEKLSNRTEIYLPDPEIEFNHLWGSPGLIGNRRDISVKQSFDIPTIIGIKSRLANRQDDLVVVQYNADRLNILLRAKQYCIELIYCNRMLQELQLRLAHVQTIETGYKTRLETGDVNIIDYNKTLLNLAAIEGEIYLMEIEKNSILSELKRLNGGEEVVLNEVNFPDEHLPADFSLWFTSVVNRNPILEYAMLQVELNRYKVTLSKVQGLPTFSAGYMREKTLGQNYQGLSVGMSVPLWSNKNNIKQAKAAVAASEAIEEDARSQFYGELERLFFRAEGLYKTVIRYHNLLLLADNTESLNKALDTGQISLLEYMMELSFYYDIVSNAVEAERDYYLTLAELTAMEL